MSELLREYLMGLGFKIDEDGWAKFKSHIGSTHSLLGDLAGAAAGTAIAVTAAVETAARRYEELYYIAQRSQTSVKGFESFAAAGKLIGISYDQARGAVEGFATSIRTNPGVRSLAHVLGISTDPSNGLPQLVEHLKGRFGEKGYFAATQFASMFGVDETTFRHMWMNLEKLKAAQVAAAQKMDEAGIDAEKSAGRFLEYSNSVDRLATSFEQMRTRIAIAFVDPAEKGIKLIDQMIQKWNRFDKEHGGTPAIVETLGMSSVVGALSSALLGKLLGVGALSSAALPLGILGGGILAGGAVSYFGQSWADDYFRAHPDKTPRPLKSQKPSDINKARSRKWWTDEEAEKEGLYNPPGKESFLGGQFRLGDTNTSSRQVNINQKTDIHIAAGASPAATANDVAQRQDRVNADLIRNMSGAVA